MPDPAVVAPEGEIDIATVDGFRAALTDGVDAGDGHVVVDLTGVSFIDSTGLGAVVDASRHCVRRGGRLAVVAPQGTTAAVVLQLTGLGQALHVVESRDRLSPGGGA